MKERYLNYEGLKFSLNHDNKKRIYEFTLGNINDRLEVEITYYRNNIKEYSYYHIQDVLEYIDEGRWILDKKLLRKKKYERLLKS